MLALAIVAIVAVLVGWFAHRAVSINYKKRWLKAVELQKQLYSGDTEEEVNGWKITVETSKMQYTDGRYKGRKLDGVYLLLSKDERTIHVNPRQGSIGLDPAMDDFPQAMAEYRAKARALAQSL